MSNILVLLFKDSSNIIFKEYLDSIEVKSAFINTNKSLSEITDYSGIHEDEENLNSKYDFLKKILRLLNDNIKLINISFENNQLIKNALNLAADQVINNINEKLDVALELATYISNQLSRSSKKLTEDEIKFEIDITIQLFAYLNDKDTFLNVIKNNLGKRLIGSYSYGNNEEKYLINKLTEICGINFTTPLTKMMEEITYSQELTTSFSNYIEQNQIHLPFMEFRFNVI